MTQATEMVETPDAPRENRGWARIALLLALVGLLFFFGWLGLKTWRLYETGNSLLARQEKAQQLLADGWRQADPDEMEALVLGIRSDLVALEQEIGFLLPYLPALSALPQIGPLAAAAPQLFDMADAGTEGAAYALRAMKPALVALQSPDSGGPLLPVLLESTATGQADLAQAALALERVSAARAQIGNSEALPWRVRTLLELSDRWLPMGQNFLRFALVMPEAMGMNGPRRYLVLAQNQDELRPTGGFLSGAGFLEVDEGRITRLDFTDANFVDAWSEDERAGGALAKPYSAAPQALETFMMLDLFLFRDANFWPDFAVSAQKAMDLYAYGRDVAPLDGAIAVNQNSLRLLLEGLGPVVLPDSGERITANNLVESLQASWTLQDGVSERKAFLGPFAAALLERVNEGMGEVDPLHLSQQVDQALRQKDLQVYLRDPRAAAILAANDWDGRLPPPDGHDAFMIVDTNVGFNKANFLVERAAAYQVTLNEAGGGSADLIVTHRHTGEPDQAPCWQGTTEEYAAGADYLALTDKCYWNYLRIYAPEGSQLNAGPQHVIPGETWYGGYDWQPEPQTLAELPGYTTFDSWMLLPRGAEVDSRFQYSLPETIVTRDNGDNVYGLRIMKQAGVQAHPLQVTVVLPQGSQFVSAIPNPTAVESNKVHFDIDLDGDQALTVTYR